MRKMCVAGPLVQYYNRIIVSVIYTVVAIPWYNDLPIIRIKARVVLEYKTKLSRYR